MKITMLAAINKHGLIADSSGSVEAWTSDADKVFLKRTKQKSNLHIMASKTYEAHRPKAVAGTLRIVMTQHPERYENEHVPHQLHFESLSPKQIIDKYHSWGNALLLGGGSAYEAFLQQGLVYDAFITKEEDKLFTEGTPLLQSGKSFEEVASIKRQITQPTHLPHTTITHYLLK